jgi:hypothetical protein
MLHHTHHGMLSIRATRASMSGPDVLGAHHQLVTRVASLRDQLPLQIVRSTDSTRLKESLQDSRLKKPVCVERCPSGKPDQGKLRKPASIMAALHSEPYTEH